jgi:hypothetical protein
MRVRIVCSFIASAIINLFAWVFFASFAQASWSKIRTETPIETIVVSAPSIRIEHRPPQHAQKKVQPRHAAAPKPQPVITPPPGGPTIALPQSWGAAPNFDEIVKNAKLFYDWKHQSSDFVPRIFLWHDDAPAQYMSRPSLRDVVGQVLASIRSENDKLYASRPQPVCRGGQPGWFFSYVKTSDDPPLHVDETLFLDGDSIYRATYVREANQPEDPKTVDALKTLC